MKTEISPSEVLMYVAFTHRYPPTNRSIGRGVAKPASPPKFVILVVDINPTARVVIGIKICLTNKCSNVVAMVATTQI